MRGVPRGKESVRELAPQILATQLKAYPTVFIVSLYRVQGILSWD
jgi:hypothetical protein